jgi:hypothetical protein
MSHVRDEQTSEPPQPPEIQRKLQFHLVQWIGMPFLILIPILAVLGVFGKTTDEARAENETVAISVTFPTRTHYGVEEIMEVRVTNTSDQTIPSLRILFDADYFSKFSQLSFVPEVDQVTDTSYEIELTDVLPDETRLLTVDYAAQAMGNYPGYVEAAAEGLESARATINTFVFP